MPYSVVPPARPGGPVFLRGPGLVEIRIPVIKNYGPGNKQFDPAQLAAAINTRLARSQAYRDAMSNPTVVGEGATLWFKGVRGAPSGGRLLDLPIQDAISAYPQDNATGKFKASHWNNSKRNELGVIFDEDIATGGFRYDRMADVLPEELVWHPLQGKHKWDGASYGTSTPNDVATDPVSISRFAFERQFDAPYVWQSTAGVAAATYMVAQEGLANFLALNPGAWTGPTPPGPGAVMTVGGKKYTVVTDAQFDAVKALEISMSNNFRLGVGPSPFVATTPTGGSGPAPVHLLTPDQVASALQRVQPPNWAKGMVDVVGSAIGGYLFKGEPIGQVVGSALFRTVGNNLLQAVYQGGLSIDLGYTMQDGAIVPVKSNVLADFGEEFATALRGAAIGSFSSFLTLELGNALGLKGFGAELLQSGASSVLGQVLNNAVDLANGVSGASLFAGLDTQGIFGSASTGTPGLLTGAIGSFFGSKLGSLILAPTNTTGAVLASIGSGAGVIALTSGATALGLSGVVSSLTSIFGNLANIGVPFVGSLVGFLLGSLIGRLFGRAKPRIPTAAAEISLSQQSGYWVSGPVTAQNGGNVRYAADIAAGAKDAINVIISRLVGGADIAPLAETGQPRQKYGHTGNTVFFDEWNGGAFVRRYAGSDATAAIDVGSVAGAKATRIRGGDLMAKRALYASRQTTVAGLLGDLVVASDYTDYVINRELINSLIADNPESPLAASWFATLARADEIGLMKFQPSDFFAGMVGFAESFGFGRAFGDGTAGLPFEDLSLACEGAALRITDASGRDTFDLLAGANNVTGPEASRSAYIAGFGANVGYALWSGQATAGNDIWDASALGPVAMDDLGYQEEWVWNPYDYAWEPVYTTVSGGDDIFIGSAHDDALNGRDGWDWLDGGGGHDIAWGGARDDVLIGRAGVDQLFGETGNDYLSGGDDNDYVQAWIGGPAPGGLHGGDGDDVLAGGRGVDAAFGDGGDDVFIVDEDGGGTWDYHDGGAGSDAASFERFSAGVGFDLTANRGQHPGYTAISYGDGFVSVENVTGSRSDDWIAGDEVANRLRGLDGADQLFGREGDDLLEGGAGADALDGGAGRDAASYRLSATGVYVELQAGVASSGDAEGDRLTAIEDVVGSDHTDYLAGDGGDNVLTGLRGDDWFVMSGGNDTLTGGDGRDALDASAATSGGLSVYHDEGYWDPEFGFHVPGAGWIASVAGLGVASLSGIEAFIGTRFADSFGGSAADELFDGGEGNDTAYGGGGSDTYVFGKGDAFDTVHDTSDGANTIQLKAGIHWRDVAIDGAAWWAQGGNLVVTVRPTGDQLVVAGNFSYVNSGANAGKHNHAIKTVSLAGLAAVDLDGIDFTPYASDEGATVVYGAQNRSDLIFAYGGDDTIFVAGNSSNYEIRGNVVYAGDGNDAVYGSGGDDQYLFERGNGADYLSDIGGIDTIVMGPSVAADDVIYEVVLTDAGAGGYGAAADLYIGLRDAANPELRASQVADRIRVAGGGTKLVGIYSGSEHLNTIEHVRVAGQEIDLAKANIDWVTSYYDDGGYYPVALDLDGDGLELRSVNGSRIAAVNADGTVMRLGWVGPDDGFLALDRDGSGAIDSIGEISFIDDLEGAKSDLEGLAAHDSNADGTLDASDARFGEFVVWRDANQDGYGDAAELLSLEQAGVRSISLKGAVTGFTAADSLDTTVLATTEIVWTDPKRVGRGYDVRLGALAVRTDDGERSPLADGDAVTRDAIDARLRGVQTFDAERAATLRAARDAITLPEGGRLHRVETLLASGKTTVNDGVLRMDGDANRSASPAGFADSGLEGSAWTLAGSVEPIAAVREAILDRKIDRPSVDAAQSRVVEEARLRVASEALAAERASAAVDEEAAAEARAAGERRVAPLSAGELDRLRASDPFRLLKAEPAGTSEGPIDAAAPPRQQLRPQATSDPEAPAVAPLEVAAAPADDRPASEPTIRPTAQRDVRPATAPDAIGYEVVISAANARLVQALAGFGRASTMSRAEFGVNDGQVSDAGWLTVDKMASTNNLLRI